MGGVPTLVQPRRARRRRRRAAAALLAGLAAVVLAAARLERAEVFGESMLPSLRPGDRLLVWRGRRLRPGDLAVVGDPREHGRRLVKRVVAVQADRVELRGDNPAQSTDSRAFGAVARRQVRGRAVYRYAPPERARRPPLGR